MSERFVFGPNYRNKARYNVNMPATPTCKSENHCIDMVKYFHIPQKQKTIKQTNKYERVPKFTSTHEHKHKHKHEHTQTHTLASFCQTLINLTHHGVYHETHKYVFRKPKTHKSQWTKMVFRQSESNENTLQKSTPVLQEHLKFKLFSIETSPLITR